MDQTCYFALNVELSVGRMEWAVIFLNGLYLSSMGLEADLWAYQVDVYTVRR